MFAGEYLHAGVQPHVHARKDVGATIDKLAEKLIPGDGVSGQTIVDAYRAMLGSNREHVREAGGYARVPQVGPVAGVPAPGIESTQITLKPGGAIEVSPVGSPPPNAIGAGAIGDQPAPGGAAPSAPPAVQGTPSEVGDTGAPAVKPTQPVTTEPGQPGYVPVDQVTAPIGQAADPDLQHLLDMGFDEDEARAEGAGASAGRGRSRRGCDGCCGAVRSLPSHEGRPRRSVDSSTTAVSPR